GRDGGERVARIDRRRIKSSLIGDELFVQVRRAEVGSVIAAEPELAHRRPLRVGVVRKIRTVRLVVCVAARRVDLERLKEGTILEDWDVELAECLIDRIRALGDPGT